MADDETRAARQKALAEKKRRLEEIKARRRGGAGDAGSGSGKGGGGASLDDYIDGLLKSSTPGLGLASPSVESSPAPAVAAAEVGESSSSAAQAAGETQPSPQNLKNETSDAGAASAATAGTAASPAATAVGGTFQPPSQVETFEIAIQTEEDDFPPPSLVDEDEPPSAIDDDEKDDGTSPDGDDSNALRKLSENVHSPGTQLGRDVSIDVRELSPEEKNDILASPSFHQFLSTASKRVERLLGASDEGLLYGILSGKGWGGGSVDFTVDYAREGEDSDDDGEFDDDDQDEDVDLAAGVTNGQPKRRRRNRNKSKSSPREAYQTGGFFTAKATYSFPRWTQGRHVTDVEWCPSHKEWVLASYNSVSYRRGNLVSGDGEGIKEALSKFTTDPATRYLSPREPSSSFLGIPTGTNQYNYASANNNGNIPNQGLVAIYNLTMPTRPEHIFCSGCPILHSQFHPTEHPKLIVGGAASGQILVWDARVGRYPVQRSSGSSMGGHDCELVGMAVLGDNSTDGGAGGGGSGGSCTMVTASSDGKVNYWSASNLREPAEHVMVPKANLSCLQVLPGGEGVVCGDERGGLHAIFASSGNSASVAVAGAGGGTRKVVKTLHAGGDGGWSSSATEGMGDDLDASLEKGADMGHFGMITAVATRSSAINAGNSPRLSNKETASSGLGGGSSRGFLRGVGGLVVTTGVDWSTKIWAPAYSNVPLLSYLSNSYDYMCDAQW